ncbi:hypothetical protein [Spirosoma aerophilum]
MTTQSPIRRFSSILPGGLALSIACGIRGNFYGEAFAGCLAAIVGALLAERADWRTRSILKNATHR